MQKGLRVVFEMSINDALFNAVLPERLPHLLCFQPLDDSRFNQNSILPDRAIMRTEVSAPRAEPRRLVGGLTA